MLRLWPGTCKAMSKRHLLLFVRNPTGFIYLCLAKKEVLLSQTLCPRASPPAQPRSWTGSCRCLSSSTSPFINHISHSEHASPLPCHFCFQITISLINQGKCIISDRLLCQLSLGWQGNASHQTIPGQPPGAGWGSPARPAGSCPDTCSPAPSATAASARHSRSPGDRQS